MVPVPEIGQRTVRDVCHKIREQFGEGPKNDRKYYNTVACGHAPFNNAGDEDHDACPGRVDMGSEGCQMYGPFWDLAGAFGQRAQQSSAGVANGNSANGLRPQGSSSNTDEPRNSNRFKDAFVAAGGLVCVVGLAIAAVVVLRRSTVSAPDEHFAPTEKCCKLESSETFSSSDNSNCDCDGEAVSEDSDYWQFPLSPAIMSSRSNSLLSEQFTALEGSTDTDGSAYDRKSLDEATTTDSSVYELIGN
jgi:hypothetical protein